MGRIARIFGFERRKLWWYRDLALTTIAAIMALWAIAALTQPESSYNRRLGIGAAAVAILCWAITPNRRIIFIAVAGIVAVQGWFAVVVSRDIRSLWIALPATLVAAGFFLKYRNTPVIRS